MQKKGIKKVKLNSLNEILWTRRYFILLFLLVYVLVSQRLLNPRQNGLEVSVASDGAGYYCYLPAALIYHDFSFSFYDDPQNKIAPFYKPNFSHSINNLGYTKYYCGVAICLLPFFLIGIGISALAGTQINGYTDTFLMLVSLAPLIYFLLSVFLLEKTSLFLSVSKKIGFSVAMVFFFGTNLYHYVIQEPSMSHAYSFFAVCLFFFLFTRLIQGVNSKKLLLLALSMGLIFLLRPTNILVILFVPFFFTSIKEFFHFCKLLVSRHFTDVCLAVLLILGCISVQVVLYDLQTESVFLVSYNGESFFFDKPEIFNTLFSYKRGLLFYTPILFLSTVFVFLAKGGWNKKLSFGLTICVFLYVTSSWWCWWYGAGFGNRPYIDIYPVFILTLIYFYNYASRFTKKVIFICCLPFIFINQVMAFQYSNRVLDGNGFESKKEYWDKFLKTDIAEISRDKVKEITAGATNYKTQIDGFEFAKGDSTIAAEGFRSMHSSKLNKYNTYSKALSIPLASIKNKESIYIIAECMAKGNKKASGLSLVISLDEGGDIKNWDVVLLNQFAEISKGWKHMRVISRIDKNRIAAQSTIKIFAMSNKGEALVDNLRYTILGDKEDK